MVPDRHSRDPLIMKSKFSGAQWQIVSAFFVDILPKSLPKVLALFWGKRDGAFRRWFRPSPLFKWGVPPSFGHVGGLDLPPTCPCVVSDPVHIFFLVSFLTCLNLAKCSFFLPPSFMQERSCNVFFLAGLLLKKDLENCRLSTLKKVRKYFSLRPNFARFL